MTIPFPSNLEPTEENFKKYGEAIKRIKIIREEREKIYKDLMEIANKGEIEDLRREVERYFKDKIDTNY